MPIRARHRSSPGTARAILLLSVAALVGLLAGCGSPEYTYVTNSTDRTYLKVPASWQQIDDKAMNDAIGFDPTLSEEERGLSGKRRQVQQVMDACSAEITRRYRDGEADVETLLSEQPTSSQ